MIRELETVVLTRDVPEHGLKKGDVGAVVYRYSDHAAFEIDILNGIVIMGINHLGGANGIVGCES